LLAGFFGYLHATCGYIELKLVVFAFLFATMYSLGVKSLPTGFPC
jgi:hypothetical protein